jgi:C4-dicarboxylate-specific signal transduction histidine kinase
VNINAVKASVNAVPSDYNGCLIRFPARFVDYQAEKYWGTLVLSTGSTTVTAEVSPETMSRLASLPLGSEIAVTGIAQMDWDIDPLAWPNRKPRQLSLIVRSDSDIAILRKPSSWTTRRLGTLLGTALAALTVAVAWGWSLRRKRGELEGMVRDRTRELTAAREREVKQEEQTRFVLQQKLKASLAAAAVAHEINQPLSRILLTSRMELEAGGDGSEPLRSIVSDADRVVTTIEKMKVLLRNVETQHEEVDLVQVARSSLFQVKSLLGTSGVTVRQSNPPAGCRIQGDAVQLQLAIVNLLRNAVEAIASGGLPRREIEVVIGETPGGATLTVSDSGPGWTGGTLDDALVATTKPAGAGVGLFVVQTAVENHRGSITVGRSPLGGAEFRIVLPRA